MYLHVNVDVVIVVCDYVLGGTEAVDSDGRQVDGDQPKL